MADSGSLVGTVVGGLYKVRRLIGQGGMGEVYAADAKTGAKVALKVLHDRAAQDPDLVARFQREASIAARIKSAYVAAILGAGKDRNGRLWIAFERLEGEGLDERLRREQYLSFADVAPIVEDALQGLEAAHQAGVIHRDIKPANLFIEKHPGLRGLEDAVAAWQEERAVPDRVRRDARVVRVHGARAGPRVGARR
jgi:serine/threonine-protein kinase